MKTLQLLLVAAAALTTVPAPAEETRPILAVFLIENRGAPLSAEEIVTLTDYLRTKLVENGRYQAIPTEAIRERLGAMKAESHKACYDKGCQIDLGRELAAQMTVSADISRIGKTCVVTAAMYDLAKAATSNTATAKAACNSDELLVAIETIAAALEGSPRPGPEDKPDDGSAGASVTIPPPAPPPQKPPEVKDVPRTFFLGLHLIAAPTGRLYGSEASTGTGQDATTLSIPRVGAGIVFDWNPWRWLLVGVASELLFDQDAYVAETATRLGALFRATKDFWVVTAVHLGASVWNRGGPDGETAVGFHGGLSSGIRWMLTPLFGLTLDLSFTYERDMTQENSPDISGDRGLLILMGLGFQLAF